MCANDSKIKKIVTAINDLGIKITFSCEGHSQPTLSQSPLPRIITVSLTDISQESLSKLLIGLSMFNSNKIDADQAWCIIPRQLQNETRLIITPIDRYSVPLENHQENINR